MLESLDISVATYQHVAVGQRIKIADMIRSPISTTDYTDVEHDGTPLAEVCFQGQNTEGREHGVLQLEDGGAFRFVSEPSL